jgi:hypothetical protein
MASTPGPSGTNSFRVTRREKDNLPDHVKGDVHWRIDQPSGPGYYILNRKNRHYIFLEFINDYWYQLCIYTGDVYTAEDSKVPINRGTGYWDINDYKHSDNRKQKDYIWYILEHATEVATGQANKRFLRHRTNLQETEEEAEFWYAVFQRIDTPPPTLTVDTGASLAADPTIFPFVTTSTATLSPFVAAITTSFPSFTEPRQAEGEDSDSTETPQSSTTNKPSPEQPGQKNQS